jgi:hypothetical protein
MLARTNCDTRGCKPFGKCDGCARVGAHHRGHHPQNRPEVAHDQTGPAAHRVFVARRAGFFHDVTGVGQRLCGMSHNRRHLWIGAPARRLWQHGHADRLGQRRAIERCVNGPGVDLTPSACLKGAISDLLSHIDKPPESHSCHPLPRPPSRHNEHTVVIGGHDRYISIKSHQRAALG